MPDAVLSHLPAFSHLILRKRHRVSASLFPFDQLGSQDPERLRNFPEVTQQRRGTICTQAV